MSFAPAAFFLGQCFNSFEEFKLLLQKYEIEKRQKYTIRASESIALCSKYLKRTISPNLKYYRVQYQCVHRSGFKPKGIGLRRTSTLRMNCPALIKLTATSCGTKLVVKKLTEEHEGHDLSEEVFEHLFHNRKLPKIDIVQTENDIAIEGDKIEIEHNLSESLKKPLTDIYDIAPVVKGNENENLGNIVELLENTYNCNVSILCSDLNEFKGLYFSTETMRRTMQAWPEFIAIDSTYKLIDDYTVLLLLIEDSDGYSEIVGVGITVSGDKEALTFFLNCFKSENIAACDKIRCIMGDKDFVEGNATSNIFPGIPSYICSFHAMKTIKRDIIDAKLHFLKLQKEPSMEYIIKLICASDDAEYNEIYEQFVEGVPKTVLKYFNDNWHNIRIKWPVDNMTNIFFSNTNNRLESIGSKIKDVLKKSNTISEFVERFFVYLESAHYAKDHFVANHVQKRPVSLFHENSWEYKYRMYLTNYAFEYVLKQISLIHLVSISISSGEGVFLVNSSGNIKTSVDNCECRNYNSMGLPCKHIFAVRTLTNISKFDKNICDQRWTREYYVNARRATSKSLNKNNNQQTTTENCLTLTHKKDKMVEVTTSLTDLGSGASDSTFGYRLGILKEIELYWMQGIEVSVVGLNVLDGHTEDNSSIQNHETIFS